MHELRQRYEDHYAGAVSAFVKEAGDAIPKGIPEVHLPLWGKQYAKADLRVAFIGRDTKGWGDMGAFLEEAKRNVGSAIFRTEEEFHELPFTDWTNNFGTTFWDTVLQYLAMFHGVLDWKDLKRREIPDVLHSFVWANTNAVEQWGVTAAHNGADFESWQRLKETSERNLDSFSAILKVFRPHVAIVMHWEVADRYWGRQLEWEKLADYASYAHDAETGTQIFATAHPTWLNLKGIRHATFDAVCSKWKSIFQSVNVERHPS
jgi:hypothetical protein